MDSEQLSEQELVAAAQSGDRAALSALLEAQYNRVFAVCVRMMGDRHAAEDQAQETLIRITRSLSTFDGRASLSTWCHRVATTTCLDEMRRRRRRPATSPLVNDEGVSVDPEQPHSTEAFAGIEWSDVRSDIADALNAIPREFAEAVVLRDVLDLEYNEIAELMNVAPGTVKSRIARGRGMLAERLRGNQTPGDERPTGGENP